MRTRFAIVQGLENRKRGRVVKEEAPWTMMDTDNNVFCTQSGDEIASKQRRLRTVCKERYEGK